MAVTRPLALTDTRRHLFRALALSRRQARIAEDDYRLLLARHGAAEVDGVPSATTLPDRVLRQVLARLRQVAPRAPEGGAAGQASAAGPVAAAGGEPSWSGAAVWKRPRLRLCTALWCQLADAGVVRDRGESALRSWARRTAALDRMEWADSSQLNTLVEALKDWCKRAGVDGPDNTRSPA